MWVASYPFRSPVTFSNIFYLYLSLSLSAYIRLRYFYLLPSYPWQFLFLSISIISRYSYLILSHFLSLSLSISKDNAWGMSGSSKMAADLLGNNGYFLIAKWIRTLLYYSRHFFIYLSIYLNLYVSISLDSLCDLTYTLYTLTHTL